jgi:hypothetical protein
MEEIITEMVQEMAKAAAESDVENGGLGLVPKALIVVGGAALLVLTGLGINKAVKNKKNAKNEAEEAGEDSVEESIDEAK